jgi:hypothetical protein
VELRDLLEIDYHPCRCVPFFQIRNGQGFQVSFLSNSMWISITESNLEKATSFIMMLAVITSPVSPGVGVALNVLH